MASNFILIFVFLFSQLSFSGTYHRKQWRHWIDEDRDCQNTRQEILISRSEDPVILNKKGCVVKRGKWRDYYFDEILTLANQVDVDHLVPLKHAHVMGGEKWSKIEKKQFANDPENLVLTNKIYNRKKGAKSISEWLPLDRTYACKYIADWMKIKKKYHLIIPPKELETQALLKCP
jgi:hypothetical protein